MKLYIDSVFGNFSIADTGEVWECCCTRIPELKLPEKLFVEAWQSEDSFKLKYLTGGIATFEHCLLIKMRNGLPQYIISDQNIISSSFKE